MNTGQIEHKLKRRSHSPLSVRLAQEYLNEGRLADAHRLCLSGINLYPSYSNAYFILAKILYEEQNYDGAIENIRLAISINPFSPAFAAFENKIKAAIPERNEPMLLPGSQYNPTKTDVDPALLTDSEIGCPVTHNAEENTRLAEIESVTEALPVETIPAGDLGEIGQEPDGDLSESAPEIQESGATKICPAYEIKNISVDPDRIAESVEPEQVRSVVTDPDTGSREPVDGLSPVMSLSGEGRIVSKTLAEIYAAQGEYAEAITTYGFLKQMRPDLTGEIERRIKELEMMNRPKSQNGQPERNDF